MTQIKIKRGLEANRSQVTAATGEPLWATDKDELWVGDGKTPGGIPIGTIKTSGALTASKINVALYKDTTGKVLQPQTKDDFLKDYSTSAQVDAKIASKVPAIKVNSANHADKATDSDKLGNKAASLYVDNSRVTDSYTENNASKVVSSKGITKMDADIRAAVPNIKVSHATLADTATDANKLGNKVLSTGATGDTVVQRDSSGDITGRYVRSVVADQTTIAGAMAFRTNNSSDNYLRYCSDPTAVRAWLHTIGNTNGQNMTGTGAFINFNYAAGSHGCLRGVKGGSADWYVGRGSAGADGVAFSNYKNASITLKDNDNIYYKGTSHTFSSVVTAAGGFTASAQAYPSISLTGQAGKAAMMELDGGTGRDQNLNFYRRDISSGRNDATWSMQHTGFFDTPKGIHVTATSNSGGSFGGIADGKAPIEVGNVFINQKATGVSAYAPMITGSSKPVSGKCLYASFGLYYDGADSDSAAIVVTGVNGRDTHYWSFTHNGIAVCAGGWVKGSDRRLKENVVPIIPEDKTAMSIVNSFEGKQYNLIADEAKRTQYGFIAQDMQSEYPHAVSMSGKMGDIEDCLAVDYDSVVPLHHEALKELEAENKALKDRLAIIEAKLGL